MSDYDVDPDALFSDDDVPAPAAEEEPPSPVPQKRPRPPARSGSSALDALDNLDLSSFKGANGYGGGGSYGGRSGGARGGYRGRPGRHQSGRYGGDSGGSYGGRSGGYGGRSGGSEGGYGGRSGGYGGRSGGYGGRSGGVENGFAIGDHMRAGAPAPAKGRPGIHPSRLANLAPEPEEPKFLSREEQRDAALSILSEADRQKLRAQEDADRPQRKRPGRRSSGGGSSRPSEPTWEDRQAEKRAEELRKSRAKGFGRTGFNLMEAMKVAGSGNPSSSRKRRDAANDSVASTKRRRREQHSSSAYMQAILGKDGMKRKQEKERREREEREAEISWLREKAKSERDALLKQWKSMGTEASRRRNNINLMFYEDQVVFGKRDDRKKRFNMEAFGLELRNWKSRFAADDVKKADEICFVAVSDDI